MDSREVVIRPVEDQDEGRSQRLVALLAIAFERYFEAAPGGVDFRPGVRVYPSVPVNDPEAVSW